LGAVRLPELITVPAVTEIFLPVSTVRLPWLMIAAGWAIANWIFLGSPLGKLREFLSTLNFWFWSNPKPVPVVTWNDPPISKRAFGLKTTPLGLSK
jgi:hypothetical protein